jgi:hypothetical protein
VTGKVYHLADAYSSVGEVVSDWLHEQGLHVGIRGWFGEDQKGVARFEAFLDRTFEHFGVESFAELAKAHGIDLATPEGRRHAAEERLASIAEKVDLAEALDPREQSQWREFVDLVRGWLRDRGVNVALTDQEIARVVRSSVRWTVEGDARRGGTDFDRDLRNLTPEQNLARGAAAMDRVISAHADALDAMFRPEVGGISFFWGEPGSGEKFKGGSGIAHIVAKHGEDVARLMPEVIARGIVSEPYTGRHGGDPRVNITRDSHTAVLSLYRFGKKQTWLVTGWEDSTPGASQAFRGPGEATHVGATPVRPDMGAGASSEEKITPAGRGGKPLFQREAAVEFLDDAPYRRESRAVYSAWEPIQNQTSASPSSTPKARQPRSIRME